MLYSVGTAICFARGSFHGTPKKEVITEEVVLDSLLKQGNIMIFNKIEDALAYAKSLRIDGNLSEGPTRSRRHAAVFSLELKDISKLTPTQTKRVAYFDKGVAINTNVTFQTSDVKNIKSLLEADFHESLIDKFVFQEKQKKCTIM